MFLFSCVRLPQLAQSNLATPALYQPPLLMADSEQKAIPVYESPRPYYYNNARFSGNRPYLFDRNFSTATRPEYLMGDAAAPFGTSRR